MTGVWIRATIVAAVLTGSGVLIAACDEGADAPVASAVPPPTVTVETIAVREIVAETSFIGRLEAVDQVELRSQVQGFLQEVLFTDGQKVKEGDLLFLIDPAPYQADLEQAKASVARAAAVVEQTRNQLDRSQILFDQGDLTKARLEQDKAAYRQASAELQAAQAQQSQAEIQLGYTSILAPFSGRIGTSNYSVGTLIDASSGPLAEITSLDPINVNFSIGEAVMIEVKRQRLNMGLDAAFDATDGIDALVVPTLQLPGGSMYELPGKIDFVGSNVDTRTATIAVRAIFPNPDELLSPGQFVTVIVADEDPKQAVTVPQAAVQQDKEGKFVLVVNDQDMAEERRIETAGTDGIDYVVRSGLQPGDTVIVQGILKVRPGVPVHAVFAPDDGG